MKNVPGKITRFSRFYVNKKNKRSGNMSMRVENLHWNIKDYYYSRKIKNISIFFSLWNKALEYCELNNIFIYAMKIFADFHEPWNLSIVIIYPSKYI